MLVLNPPFRGERIMKKSKLFHLKNEMLVPNAITNLIGFFLTTFLIHRTEPYSK